MNAISHFTQAQAAEAVAPLIEPWRRRDAPGLAIAVMQHGEVLHQDVAGMADLAHGIMLDERSVLRIASQSKQFTVLLILLLEADGLLSLDDSVHAHLPWLPDFGMPITLRQLAANASGLRDILETMILGGVPILAPSSRDAARRMVARQRSLNFLPDTDILYSNTNFLLLSDVIETVTGQDFATVLTERITAPLGMDDTSLMARDDEIRPRLAGHYRRGPDGRWLRSAWGIAIGGEGGLVSSLRDMALWKANLRWPVVGTKEMVARMQAPGTTINGVASPYGLGLMRGMHRGHATTGHGGWIAGARSDSIRLDALDLDVIALSNTDEVAPYMLVRRVVDRLLGVEDPMLSPSSAARLGAAAGLYREIGGDGLFAIEMRAGEPMLVSSMGAVFLADAGGDSYVPLTALPPFTFSIAQNGDIGTERFGRQKRFRLLPASPQALPAFPGGRFVDCATGLSGQFATEGDDSVLILTSPFGQWRATLEPCDCDLFRARAAAEDVHDAWRVAPWVLPWLFTVRVSADRLVLNSDRSRVIVLQRTE